MNWAEQIREDREKRAARRAEIGEAAYLAENGFDPELFKVTDGVICRKMPERAQRRPPVRDSSRKPRDNPRRREYLAIKKAAEHFRATGETSPVLRVAQTGMAVLAKRWAIAERAGRSLPVEDAWERAELDFDEPLGGLV